MSVLVNDKSPASSYTNATDPNASVRRRLYGFNELVILMVKRQSKRRIQYPSFNMHANVNFQDIATL